jgi:hypothetical protein
MPCSESFIGWASREGLIMPSQAGKRPLPNERDAVTVACCGRLRRLTWADCNPGNNGLCRPG